jgi:DNA-directed RNA polymerase I, II, and III subunit RPABC5
MIIPIKCFTCGKVIADKYEYYCKEVKKAKFGRDEGVLYFSKTNGEKTEEGHILDAIGLTRMCCRRMMLTHVDIL